jgi:hypothetical protein
VANIMQTSRPYLETKVVPAINSEGRFIAVTDDPQFIDWVNARFPDYPGHKLGEF